LLAEEDAKEIVSLESPIEYELISDKSIVRQSEK